MPEESNSIRTNLVKLVSSFFYIGYSPIVPGTIASLAGLLIYILFIKGSLIVNFAFVGLFSALGFYFSPKAERIFAKKDARQIVIDDITGVLVGFLFLPYNIYLAALVFGIFRIMDGLKPYPIYRIERLDSALGVMADDLVAGIFTNITAHLFLKLASYSFS